MYCIITYFMKKNIVSVNKSIGIVGIFFLNEQKNKRLAMKKINQAIYTTS